MKKEIKYGVPSSNDDTLPMHECDVEYINDRDKNSEGNLCFQVLNNGTIRSQVARSVCVSSAHMINSWTKGQIGPAFPDIMMISGTDLTKGSTFMTSLYTGQLLGAVVAGVIFSRMNKYLVFSTFLVISGLSLAALPWCFLYEMMIAAFTLVGFCGGILSVGTNAECVIIWGPTPRGRSYIMANSTALAIAGILAPLVTAPFLLQQSDHTFTNTTWNTTLTRNGTNTSVMDKVEIPIVNSTLATANESKLYIAYTISSVLSMTVAMMFFILFYQKGQSNIQKTKRNELKFIGKHSLLMNRLQLINIGVFSMVENALDFTFIGYLTTFCIKYLGWTSTLGATLTSMLFIARLLGLFSGIILVRYVKSYKLIVLSTIMLPIGFVGLTVSSHLYCDIGIWIFVCSIGAPLGFLWPNLISWVNEKVIPITSELSSYLVVTGYTGALLAPVFLGYVMENISFLWFCYLFCIKSIVMVANAAFMFYYTTSQHRNV